MKLVWMTLAAAIIAAGLSGGGVYYFVNQHQNTEKSSLQAKIDDLTVQVTKYKAAVANSTDTVTDTATTESSVASTDSGTSLATTSLSNYLTAKKTRGLENAKPYMTSTFYKSYSQSTFAGVSSPSMNRFDILSVAAKEVGTSYTATTKLWYSLQGQEVGYFPNTYEIIKVGSQYLVNSELQGKWTETN